MKKLLSILCTGLLLCGAGLTSCENYDDPVTGNAYGNNSIPEGRTISIAALKEKYNDFIDTSTDTYTTIEDETRIEGVIIGDDESGNIYKQLVVGDETGAIIVGVNTSGLYAFCPVGQKVVIDCKGLQIGSYRKLAQIGSDIGANLTKNMFSFLNQMETIEDNWRNSNYDISGQQLNINAYTEIGLGLSRQINSRLTVGARVKALLGIGNMELKLNKIAMSANLPTDQQINEWSSDSYWSGTPAEITAKAQELKAKFDNYHANLNVAAELKSSFKGLELKEEEGKDYVTDFDFDSGKLGIAGYGFGIDLGASYKILDNLTVSASILDLGFISWSKSSTKIASANPDPIDLKGSTYAGMIDPANPQSSVTGALNQLQSDAENYMDLVTQGDVLNYDMLQLEVGDAKESRKSRLASTLVLGAEYGFFNNKLAVGVLSTTRFVQPDALTELTFSANYRPKSWFNVALSYSAIQSAGKSFGLGLKLGPLFVGTDYMFLGKNSNSVNGFVGVSIPLGGRKASKEG